MIEMVQQWNEWNIITPNLQRNERNPFLSLPGFMHIGSLGWPRPIWNSLVASTDPPAVIYFKPDIRMTTVFEGVPEGIILISPSVTRFNVYVDNNKLQLERRQLAIVPAYAFTDYKSQGQMMEYVIVDISKPPSGSLSPFSVYVALSRSRGRKTIQILRDFDPALFMHHPSEDLRKDMMRLEHLDQMTWETYENEM